MSIFNIDWKKAESKPDMKQKVSGKLLLNLRLKINDLEKQLALKINELEIAKKSVAILASKKSDLKDKLSNAEKKILLLETKAINAPEYEKIIEQRNNTIAKFEKDFEKRMKEIEDLKKEKEVLNDQLQNTIVTPKLIKKLQNIMLYKGFIADKEFYQIMDRMIRKYPGTDFCSL